VWRALTAERYRRLGPLVEPAERDPVRGFADDVLAVSADARRASVIEASIMAPDAGRDEIALVLSGGGARGAYEAGVVSVLLPALERRGERPGMLIGTSVGAINAAHLAGAAHLPAEEATAGMLDHWREIDKGAVIKPILSHQLPLSVARYAGEILSIGDSRLGSLLDPEPLARSLRRWIDWRALHDNVHSGAVRSVAAVATAACTGRTVAFVEGDPPCAPAPSRSIDYVPSRLGLDHIRASAALPVLFPPVRVGSPTTHEGWYLDGGTRLNTPLRPALDLGARRLVVVGTDAVAAGEAGSADCDPPDIGDGALHLLQGILVDPLIRDVWMLGRLNVVAMDARRQSSLPYRVVPYIFVSPLEPGAIGELAMEVFRSRYGGLKGLRSPDLRLLNRLLGGESPTHGELLSYLLFDPEFVAELVEMGIRDATAWLQTPPGPEWPWQLRPLEAMLADRAPRAAGAVDVDANAS
jgi:NTE family protein